MIFRGADPPAFEVRGARALPCPRGSYGHEVVIRAILKILSLSLKLETARWHTNMCLDGADRVVSNTC